MVVIVGPEMWRRGEYGRWNSQAGKKKKTFQQYSVAVGARNKPAVSANRLRKMEGGSQKVRDIQAKQPVSFSNSTETSSAAIFWAERERNISEKEFERCLKR